MLRLASDIQIADFRFKSVVEVGIQSSWDFFTDTCTITIPRKLAWKDKPIATTANALFKRGQRISVSLGYGSTTKRFSGYVHQIKAGIPTMIECQDDFWLLKQNTITESFENISLKELLSAVLPNGVPYQAPDVGLGQFRITRATPAQILDELKKDYYIKSWMRNGTLYCGFAYVPELQSEYVIRMNRNVVENNLEYFVKDDIRIKLTMISIQSDNTRVEYEAGDSQGEQRTLYYYDKSLSDLKLLADAEIERLRYDGYRGSLTIFGEPFFQHGDILNLKDESYPERDGRYFVKSVETSFGQSGFRQTLELDARL